MLKLFLEEKIKITNKMTIKQYLTQKMSSAIDGLTGRKQREVKEEQRYQRAVRLVDLLRRSVDSNARSKQMMAWSDAASKEEFNGSFAEYCARYGGIVK